MLSFISGRSAVEGKSSADTGSTCRTLSVLPDLRRPMTGTVEETYAAAIQHDLYDGDATRVGVVRRPTGWFRAVVDENVPAVAPPEELLDEAKQRHEELKLAGMCDEGAHNAAWEETDFETRYHEHLDTDADAQAAVEALLARVRAGEDLALVCFEGDAKRCHRRVLRARLRDRL
jgi:uncharacterized protein YeaO (DUF488 family)